MMYAHSECLNFSDTKKLILKLDAKINIKKKTLSCLQFYTSTVSSPTRSNTNLKKAKD